MEELMRLVQAYGKARLDTGRYEQAAHIAPGADELAAIATAASDELLERIRLVVAGSLSAEEATEALALIDHLAWDNGATLADVVKDAEGLEVSLLSKLQALRDELTVGGPDRVRPYGAAGAGKTYEGLRVVGEAVDGYLAERLEVERLAAASDVAPAVVASERAHARGSNLEYTVNVSSDYEHEAQRWQGVGRIGDIREVRYHADRKAAERKATGAALETYGRMLREGA